MGMGMNFFLREWVWDSETRPRPAPLPSLFVVGWVVLPLRFDLSQALSVCVVVFQVYKRVLAVLV